MTAPLYASVSFKSPLLPACSSSISRTVVASCRCSASRSVSEAGIAKFDFLAL
eukprot:CAMPEP_0177564118 /NCGR_PEP_ID=MMETSP0369-20130122/73453_1 /TAXON_ID=447022 ORGANISM="Scrippsiella hangoei-like, Strain SHHI-4" /NCGR_SAMPLE_ID=MMETSP0369 /ASSEMBLY_ACC=CAM_ASM_000364 /LENGTH=52 /DNA_ID=CAMNT_0019051401 /DNA_START=455 /DNA_END=613 /DNA_ORIENTATION=-